MISAAAWHCEDHCGVLAPGGRSWQMPSPTDTSEMLTLIGRPVKHFGRITSEGRDGAALAAVLLWEILAFVYGVESVTAGWHSQERRIIRARRKLERTGHASHRIPIGGVDAIRLATLPDVVGIGADIKLGFVMLPEQ